MDHTISIIIPAHNEQQFLPGLFASLKNNIDKHIEIVVVDNGSTDNTAAVLSGVDCKLINLSQKVFPSVARNIGVSNSVGEILVFLDADIEITPEWAKELFVQQEALSGGTKIITGDQYHISKQPSWIERCWFKPLRSKKPSYINGGNLITNRASYEAIAGFDESLETGEDVDFCKRALMAGVEMIINPHFVALHEGYPKTLSRFIKRERWHGVGDFQSIKIALASKVALATFFFVALNALFLGGLLGALASQEGCLILVVSALAIVSLCFISALHRFRLAGWRYVLSGIPIAYLYYCGRALSLFDVFRSRIRLFL